MADEKRYATLQGHDTLALPTADLLDVTEVHALPEGDTRFPVIDPAVWQETARERHPACADDSADYSYVTYRRHPRSPPAAMITLTKQGQIIAPAQHTPRCAGRVRPL